MGAKTAAQITTDLITPGVERQEMIVDLKYRGDYTPETRKLVQPLIVANDLEGFAKAIANEKYWVDGKNVPLDRFKRRRAFIEEAVAKKPLTSTN